ncbi:MAG: glycosyltransferase [Salinivirgaceae bacterium]|nr:glycosyltransferase [Salinivirgaceae bacterium]
MNFKQVVFSGFLPYFAKLINALKPAVTTKILYHGFLSELSGNEKQTAAFAEMLELLKSGKIQVVGCVKKGLVHSLSKMYGIKANEIILPNKSIATDIIPMTNDVNIGCLVNTSFRKNIHNQATAALMVAKSTLHIFETTELVYLPQNRIKYYPLMNHQEFVSLLSQMTINLHVTFSESWGLVLAESISQGVPCLSAYTSSFFDYDDDLKQKLIVDGFDDSWHIYRKIEEVLKDRDAIGKQCIEYAKRLNVLAEERLNEFLNN